MLHGEILVQMIGCWGKRAVLGDYRTRHSSVGLPLRLTVEFNGTRSERVSASEAYPLQRRVGPAFLIAVISGRFSYKGFFQIDTVLIKVSRERAEQTIASELVTPKQKRVIRKRQRNL